MNFKTKNEENKTLKAFSALSPQWIKDSSTITKKDDGLSVTLLLRHNKKGCFKWSGLAVLANSSTSKFSYV